jgi:tryptophan-rich sensory protein
LIEELHQHGREIAVAVALAIALGTIGGLSTEVGPWYEGLRFPALRPPNWLFAPAWALIYALIATSGVLAWGDAPDARTRGGLLALFAVNAALGAGWSWLFFKWRRPDWALVEVLAFWLSIVALVVYIAPFSPRAAGLLAPYLSWVGFASWLNGRIVILNRPFGRASSR